MRRFLLINPRSGDGEPSADDLVSAARDRGVEAHVLRPGEDAAELAAGTGAGILGMARGDGSLAPVAQVARDTDAADKFADFSFDVFPRLIEVNGHSGFINCGHDDLPPVHSA